MRLKSSFSTLVALSTFCPSLGLQSKLPTARNTKSDLEREVENLRDRVADAEKYVNDIAAKMEEKKREAAARREWLLSAASLLSRRTLFIRHYLLCKAATTFRDRCFSCLFPLYAERDLDSCNSSLAKVSSAVRSQELSLTDVENIGKKKVSSVARPRIYVLSAAYHLFFTEVALTRLQCERCRCC